ncbi:TPA: ATP-binding cassette domain-containing protein, partial [Clostridium botulinum]|nr:ATP-binding cassette domain-containing protein [Clostridium botulinum]
MEDNEPVLDVKNISKKRGKTPILKDVNFSIGKGEICGFVGRNGTGKTTLMKIITSMLFPDEGEIIICGRNLKTEREEALKNIGAVIETPEMYGYLTGRQNLNYIASMLKDVTKD